MKNVERDWFIEMLVKADDAAARPALRGDIARQVWKRMGRRKMARRMGGGFAAVLVVAGLGLAVLRMGEKRPMAIAPPAQVQETMEESNQLQALVAQETADAILLGRREERARAETPIDPRLQVQIELDGTAGFLMTVANGEAKAPGGAAEAKKDYQRVESCFPETPYATQAAERLRQLSS